MTSSLTCFGQHLTLVDIVKVYNAIYKNPANSVNIISAHLVLKSKGWTGPHNENSKETFARSWKYYVGDVNYGKFQFLVQKNDGKSFPKLAYECPYGSLYDSFKQQLLNIDAELVDNFTTADGGLQSVYKQDRLVFIIIKYEKSLNRYYLEGKSTAYFKFLMHPVLD